MIFLVEAAYEDLARLEIQELQMLFAYLIDADRKGHHFFLADRALCRWIGRNAGNLGDRDTQHLDRICQRFTTLGNITSQADRYAKIVIGDAEVSLDTNNGCYTLGHKTFIQGGYAAAKTALVVENKDSDGDFYKHLLDATSKNLNFPHYNFDVVHGGGGSTASVFSGEIDKSKVVLCIVDTDKMAPQDKHSSTCLGVTRVDRNASYMGDAFSTAGHEMENYIPFQCLELIHSSTPNTAVEYMSKKFPVKSDIEARNEFLLFFDFKKGLSPEKFLNKNGDPKKSTGTSKWISKKLNITEKDLLNTVVPGFGNSIASDFLNSGDAIQEFRKFVNTKYWKDTFESDFRSILWYMAAPRPSIT